MTYKYQGLGAGPTTRGQMIGLTITVIGLFVVYVVGVPWLAGYLR